MSSIFNRPPLNEPAPRSDNVASDSSMAPRPTEQASAVRMKDDIENFKDWFLSQPPSSWNVPDGGIRNYGILAAMVLFRQPPYQVELFINLPGGPEPTGNIIHAHPNVDSIEVLVTGFLDFRLNGRSGALSEPLRVYPGDKHGAFTDGKGASFLSIQKWLNGVEPTSVGLDWDGEPTTPEQAALLRGTVKDSGMRVAEEPADGRRPVNVLILTHCHNPALLYGATLTFKTLRTGFPTANVTVYENASIDQARPLIRAAAMEVGARFVQLSGPLAHEAWLRRILTEYPLEGPVVILDPDLMFWENVEDVAFGDALISGRLIPKFMDKEITGCLTMPRLHTSFLVIPDIGRLRDRILEIESSCRFGTMAPLRLIEQTILQGVGGRVLFDTAANLYAALAPTGEARAFDETVLKGYDHLFFGSHLDHVLEKSGGTVPAEHEAARAGQLHHLRGIWKGQENYFLARAQGAA